MSIATIALSRKVSSLGLESLRQAYYMTVVATLGTGQPAYIFAMNSNTDPLSEALNKPPQEFTNVTSPIEYTDLPIDGTTPRLRAAAVTLVFSNPVDMEDTWEGMQQDVQGLITAINSGATILADGVEETVVIS